MCILLKETLVANVKNINDMSRKCSSKISEFELSSGAVICEHYNYCHTLYYRPHRLQDLCVNHYIKRYMKEDKTELTLLPNWKFLVNGKYKDELEFVMILCKENVGY